MIDYVLSAHAATVLAERSISREWLDRALSSPERTEKDKADPELLHVLARVPEHGGRVLRVV